MHTHTHTSAWIQTRAHGHMCTRARAHTHTHTHTHTHINASNLSLQNFSCLLRGYFEDSHHYEVSVSGDSLLMCVAVTINEFFFLPQAANLTVQLFTVPSLVREHDTVVYM